MSDIVERLRDYVMYPQSYGIRDDAADHIEVLYQEIVILEHELAAAQKDAERYRWLRNYEVDSYLACGSGEKLDSEIDQALQEKT